MLDNEHRPHMKKGPIKYTKGYTTRLYFFRTINAIIILLFLALIAGAIYVYVKQPVKTDDGYVIASPIYEMIEHGERVLIIEDDNYNLFTPLKRALIPQKVHKVRIVAGPYGKIEKAKEKYRVTDGVNVINVNLEDPKKYLDMEYVARKINSSDENIEGELDVIVNKEQILGGIINQQK